MRFNLILLMALAFGCTPTRNQVYIRKNNPSPNRVMQSDFRQTVTESQATAYFRDPSIHMGGRASSRFDETIQGHEAFTVTQFSSIPPKDMLNINLVDWDLEKYEIVKFSGESKGCRTGVTIIIPHKNNQGTSYVPISFQFGAKSFYEELNKQMEENKIVGLFDSRLDQEDTRIFFGLLGKKCYRFNSYALREKR